MVSDGRLNILANENFQKTSFLEDFLFFNFSRTIRSVINKRLFIKSVEQGLSNDNLNLPKKILFFVLKFLKYG